MSVSMRAPCYSAAASMLSSTRSIALITVRTWSPATTMKTSSSSFQFRCRRITTSPSGLSYTAIASCCRTTIESVSVQLKSVPVSAMLCVPLRIRKAQRWHEVQRNRTWRHFLLPAIHRDAASHICCQIQLGTLQGHRVLAILISKRRHAGNCAANTSTGRTRGRSLRCFRVFPLRIDNALCGRSAFFIGKPVALDLFAADLRRFAFAHLITSFVAECSFPGHRHPRRYHAEMGARQSGGVRASCPGFVIGLVIG
jgi:hypothetical protein